MMMTDELSVFNKQEFSKPIEEFKELLSQNRRAFLIGAGCSKIAGLPLMPELTKMVLEYKDISKKSKEILVGIKRLFSGADSSTIEDYMSELVDHLSIANRRTQKGSKESIIQLADKQYSPEDLKKALEEVKKAIEDNIKKEVNISDHQAFIRAVHSILQAGKPGNEWYVDYFILNYDTLIEDALGLECIHYIDGFSGGATGWWDPGSFKDLDNIPARVFKLHGSIDWCLLGDDILPRRIRTGIRTDAAVKHILIYPAATKYRETQRNPYAQILGQMRDSLRPEKEKEIVLTICGYGFGDSHIDLEVDNALHESEGRLTILAFTSNDEPEGQLKAWLDDPDVQNQVRVHANRGFFHGTEAIKSEKDLSWWKFESLVKLLAGEKL
jgi:hypothetical protein